MVCQGGIERVMSRGVELDFEKFDSDSDCSKFNVATPTPTPGNFEVATPTPGSFKVATPTPTLSKDNA